MNGDQHGEPNQEDGQRNEEVAVGENTFDALQ